MVKTRVAQKAFSSYLIIMFKAREETSLKTQGFACQTEVVLSMWGKWQ